METLIPTVFISKRLPQLCSLYSPDSHQVMAQTFKERSLLNKPSSSLPQDYCHSRCPLAIYILLIHLTHPSPLMSPICHSKILSTYTCQATLT